MRKAQKFLLLVGMFMLTSGFMCLGKTKTKYVIHHAGRPMQVMENVKVKGKTLGRDHDAVEQDVGGWVMMPKGHWDTIKPKLEE